ncbi:ABC transporter substrate-binding protein [Ruminococcus gauvreauii]|uniref:ABC transporter substrate-binding protein n=1 Tax=Ruminococcus gauvreauii TaxID=438033 RepID=UPI0039841816
MKAKRITALLAAAAMTVSLMTGCSSGGGEANNPSEETDKKKTEESSDTASGGANDPVEISFWTLSSYQALTEKVVSDFEQDHPEIKVNVTINSTDDQKSNLKVAAASDSLPDIWYNWGGSLASYYTENGFSYDFTEYAKENNWSEKFEQNALDLLTLDGNLAGYPMAWNNGAIYYRTDIFEELGLEVPQTYEEFEAVCAKLKENGVTPLALAGSDAWDVMRMLELWIEMYAGPEEHDKLQSLSTSWDCDAVVKSFEKFKEFTDKGYFPDGFVSLGYSDVWALFYSGKAAMTVDFVSTESTIETDGQDLSNYGVFHLPLADDGSGRATALASEIQFNAKLADDQKKFDACMTFTDYMFGEEGVDKYAELHQLPLGNKGYEFPENRPLGAAINDMMKYGTFNITDQALPQEVVDKLFECQDAVAMGSMTPEDAAAVMQAAAEAYQSAS